MDLREAVENANEIIQSLNHGTMVRITDKHAEALRTLIEHAEKPFCGQITQCDNCQTRVLVPWAELFLCMKCDDEQSQRLRKESGDVSS